MSMKSYELTSIEKEKIQQWVEKFPKGKEKSAVLMGLMIIQNNHRWLKDEHLDALASFLKIEKVSVYEVASFYSMYHREPVGKYVIKVCVSISCHLCKAGDLLSYCRDLLDIDIGQTTKDGLFTLKEAECLAACTKAPVVIVNDKDYHESMNPTKLKNLIDSLRDGEAL